MVCLLCFISSLDVGLSALSFVFYISLDIGLRTLSSMFYISLDVLVGLSALSSMFYIGIFGRRTERFFGRTVRTERFVFYDL
jgi:hypothetical protein